ncbi:MAG: ATP-binding protein [Candidatus Aminicenantes bacterium]|nr:ATP-binding protein [Candidatus Aminicenantes bacterium]
MIRTIESKLLEWKNSEGRKPLVLKGARQTGKTYSLKKFGTKEFRRLHYINFQENRGARKLFSGNLNPGEILEAVEFYLDTQISPGEDALFLDEIQDCPSALTSLKYFCENMPRLAVVCAGSLLGVTQTDEPFPVGKVDFLHLYPMSFEEFLLAVDDGKSREFLDKIKYPDTIPEIIHGHLMDRLKEYFIVGGLPEVVQTYRDKQEKKHEAFLQARKKQEALITAYMSDFSKYAGKVNANEIALVFQSIPSQLARENKKFKASDAVPGSRFSRLQSPIHWLVGAGLLLKTKIVNSGEIPFEAFTQHNRFKLYLFDVGILGALAKIPPRSLYLESDLFFTFKGAFCENYTAQEFIYSGCGHIYGWMSNTAEVEFLREIDGDVYPVEVKAGLSGKLKSLNVFAKKYRTKYRVRISARNLEFNDQSLLHSYPLYLAHRFPLK